MTVDANFRGPEICRLTGISYRQLDYWDRNDILRPSIASANGSGSLRRYSYEDVFGLSVIAHMISAGVSLLAARGGIIHLRRFGSPDDVALVVGRDGAHLLHTPADLAAVLENGARVLSVVNLLAVREELDEAISQGSRVLLVG